MGAEGPGVDSSATVGGVGEGTCDCRRGKVEDGRKDEDTDPKGGQSDP